MKDLSKLFDDVDLHGRANLLWAHGELITTVEYYRQKVNLYLVKDFYAELTYNPELNKITRIEKSDRNSLTKFVSNINLDL